jgi:hypothetical protein
MGRFGKDFVVRRLRARVNDCCLYSSHTTRSQRCNLQEGFYDRARADFGMYVIIFDTDYCR